MQLLLPGIVQQQQVQLWQGQYPPPEAIEKYEKVLPGAFDRMIRMAEASQTAQVQVAQKSVDHMARDTARGHWLGFATTLAAMFGAIAAVALHQPWVAGGFLGVPVMAVARALVESAKTWTTSAQLPTPPAQAQRPRSQSP
jgi:uncharacterized membrane protein